MGANLASSRDLVQQDRRFRAKTFTGQHILPEDCDHPQGTALKQATWSTTSCGVSEKQPARERSLLNLAALRAALPLARQGRSWPIQMIKKWWR
jgi:hypothetical protein